MNTPKYTPNRDRAGFTIVELIVVLAMIGLVAATLLPALASSKPNSQLFQCMNNLKQLQRAWLMYADDNADRLVNLSTYATDTSGNMLTITSTDAPWRTQISKMSVNLPPGIVVDTLPWYKFMIQMGFKEPISNLAPTQNAFGPLYPYAPNLDVVHCPADFRANLQYGAGLAWDSYSGTAYLNGELRNSGSFFSKRTQVLHPSIRFTWVENSDSRGEDLGSWEMSNYGTAAANFADALFGDPPAAFHQTSAAFPFVDGHVEAHQWQKAATVAYANDMTPTKDSGGATRIAANAPGNPDLQWIGSHYPAPGNP
jgi:prepilin-type N-terminal cleavage/methylation domain-containing protein